MELDIFLNWLEKLPSTYVVIFFSCLTIFIHLFKEWWKKYIWRFVMGICVFSYFFFIIKPPPPLFESILLATTIGAFYDSILYFLLKFIVFIIKEFIIPLSKKLLKPWSLFKLLKKCIKKNWKLRNRIKKMEVQLNNLQSEKGNESRVTGVADNLNKYVNSVNTFVHNPRVRYLPMLHYCPKCEGNRLSTMRVENEPGIKDASSFMHCWDCEWDDNEPGITKIYGVDQDGKNLQYEHENNEQYKLMIRDFPEFKDVLKTNDFLCEKCGNDDMGGIDFKDKTYLKFTFGCGHEQTKIKWPKSA